MNAAFIYAFDQDNYNCYCFHDVDLVPEDDRNMYSCGQMPKHMSIGVDEMNYKFLKFLPYSSLFFIFILILLQKY
jgi:beta-1,4-galactosyltransferase 1